MSDPDPDLVAALDYFRRHGDAYSVEALAEQLRQAGTPPEVIDRAAAAYRNRPKPERWGPGVVRRALLIAACTLAVALLPFLSGPDYRHSWGGDFFGAFMLEGALAVVELVFGAILRHRKGTTGRALMLASAIAFALAAVLFVITLGTCRIGG